MARTYGRLAHAACRGDEVPSRVVEAMRTRPFLVGGTERFDSILMEQTEGRVLAKVGAEGVHSLALLDAKIGAALKVEDGAQRAQYPAVLRLLQYLGALPDPLPQPLAEFLRRPVRNTRGEVVGDALRREEVAGLRHPEQAAQCTRSSRPPPSSSSGWRR